MDNNYAKKEKYVFLLNSNGISTKTVFFGQMRLKLMSQVDLVYRRRVEKPLNPMLTMMEDVLCSKDVSLPKVLVKVHGMIATLQYKDILNKTLAGK